MLALLLSITLVCTVLGYYIAPWITWLLKVREISKALRPWYLPVKFHWFLGNIAAMPGQNEELLMLYNKWVEQCPRLYTFYFGSLRPYLILVHPETIKVILKTSEPKQLSGSGGGYNLLLPWLGTGLLVASGKQWRRNRKLLTPGFHFDILKSHIEIHNRCVEITMDKLEAIALGKIEEDKKSVEIFELVSVCTLDVIVKCIFSSSTSIQIQDENNYLTTVESIKKLVMKRALNPLLYNDFIYYLTNDGKELKKLVQFSHARSMKTIENRRLEMKDSTEVKDNKEYLDFLDILLLARDEDGSGFTYAEILNEVETFMFEGHDTTSAGIAWLLYNLAKHPEYQKKAQAEIDSS